MRLGHLEDGFQTCKEGDLLYRYLLKTSFPDFQTCSTLHNNTFTDYSLIRSYLRFLSNLKWVGAHH